MYETKEFVHPVGKKDCHFEPFRTQHTRSEVQGCPSWNSFTGLRHRVSEMKTHPHTYYNFLIKKM